MSSILTPDGRLVQFHPGCYKSPVRIQQITREVNPDASLERISMPPFTHLLLVCCNKRPDGHPRGCCDPEQSEELRKAFKEETKKRNLGPLVRATKSGCLEQCQHGPVVAIYPQGIFYGHVTKEDIPRIFDETVENDRVIEELLIQDECLNNPQCEHVKTQKSS